MLQTLGHNSDNSSQNAMFPKLQIDCDIFAVSRMKKAHRWQKEMKQPKLAENKIDSSNRCLFLKGMFLVRHSLYLKDCECLKTPFLSNNLINNQVSYYTLIFCHI